MDVSPQILAASQWLLEQKEPPRLAVPVLRETFGLSAIEACLAIRLAREGCTSLRTET